MPRLPPKFLPRPEDLDALKEKILGEDQHPVVVTGSRRGVNSIQGMGGIGKSVLAAAIARDVAVRQAFPDGVYWVSLGQEPNVLSLQTELAKELGDETPDFSDMSGGKRYLTELLTPRCCFVVLDDIWQEQHLRAFDVLGDQCQMLITTRDSGLVTGIGAVEHSLNLLSSEQARVLLAGWTGCEVTELPPQANEIARECGYLPLALSMAGAMLKKSRRWDSVLQRLQRADLDKIKQQFPDYEYPDLLKMLQVSVDALEPELQERYLDFAVFPEDARIPQTVLETFWAPHGLDGLDVGDIVDDLVAKSLLRRDDQDNLFLHDLQYDYIVKQVKDLPELHQRWLDAYKEKCEHGWASCPQDGYFFGQLTRHLKEAGQLDELRQLLFDYDWLRAQLNANGVNTLLAGYDWLTDDTTLKLLQRALRLSSHVLATKPQQLNQRLWGHLRDREQSELSNLLAQGATQQQSMWLQPQQANLTAPDGPMIRTLEGHSKGIWSVALSTDSTRALSGSEDNMLKLWDLTTGETLRTLEGHSSGVISVVM
ncbi:MAG: NB-ARC domain-containing protein, partial [Cyanobacteria bacterium P01_F01_bin.116]